MNAQSSRAREVFRTVVGCADAAERTSILMRECGDDTELRRRVEELLRGHDQAGQFLGFDPAAVADEPELADQNQPSSSAPERNEGEPVLAGRYKLLQRLGEGGMGVVWLAEQHEPIKRKVAIKLIKAGMDSRAVLARFEAERQALALMDHPGIARVLDSGTTGDGRPYFVMELVKGLPLTEYCDERGLHVEERLNLFCAVCAAVQHAHQKGIIHRDLKPSNVLVAESDGRPVPKIIDFGLAKALEGDTLLPSATIHTAIGAVLGTPLYMAPEQVGVNLLDVDTRADIYALGVILYECLTGTTPLEGKKLRELGWDELRRLIREVDPPRPSSRLESSDSLSTIAVQRRIGASRLIRQLRGDLDWIVMKALEKDRNRRYPSANDLALDIKRFLAFEAVEASPPSRFYQLKRFVQRNRGGVLAAGLVLLALVAGLAGTTWGLVRAEQARRQADEARIRESQRADAEVRATQLAVARQKEAEDAKEKVQQEFARTKAIYVFLRNVLLEFDDLSDTAVLSKNVAEDLKYSDLLRRAAKRLDGQFPEQPLVEANLRQTLGNAFDSIGLHADALPQWERGFELFKSQLGADNADTLYVMSKLVQSLTMNRRNRRAVAVGAECLANHLSRYGPKAPQSIAARTSLALANLRVDRLRGLRELDECARLNRTALPPEDIRAILGAVDITGGYLWAGQGKKALPLISEVCTQAATRLGKDNPVTLSAQQSLGRALLFADDRKQALSVLEECVAILTKNGGASKESLLEAQMALAEAYRSMGLDEKARALLEVIRPEYIRQHHYDPVALSLTRDLIWTYTDMGQHDQAIALAREEAKRIRGWKPLPEYELASILTALGRAQGKAGKIDDAVKTMQEALEIRNRIQRDTWYEATAQAGLGQVLLAQGKAEEAEPLLIAGYNGIRERPGALYPYVQQARLIEVCKTLSTLYQHTDRPADAAKWRSRLSALTAEQKK